MNHTIHRSMLDRRRFLQHTWHGVGASLSFALLSGRDTLAQPRLGTNPFTLGVASGDPTDDGIVLWTRLAPDPLVPAALGTRAIRVGWRVAEDPQMRRVVLRGHALAPSELAHSVHVEVEELRPGRDYFYQFDLRGEESGVGHFRTTPRPSDMVREMRFAVATCQDWPSGYYVAYRDMLQHDLDMVFHLGDYTYEYAIGGANRSEGVPPGFEHETIDLHTYRLRHALHKLDPDLQAAHARFPFVVIWDDHEVQNDYSGLSPEFGVPSPEFTARRAAAYQAYYEHMPLRQSPSMVPSLALRIFSRRSRCWTRGSTARTTPAATASRFGATPRSPATTRCSADARSSGSLETSSAPMRLGISWPSSS
jgi:alkaline phosphatase D